MNFRAIETIAVRGNEIAFTGAVPPSTFSRYSETARWLMFRDPVARERVRLGGGVARAHHQELLRDVTYPSTLRFETTIARLGRTSIDMLHHIVRVDDETHVASTRVTIVQLGPDGPSPIDPSMAEFVTPSESAAPLVFEPGPPEFETTIFARPSDQDQFRHVNQARYVDFADDVRWLAHVAGNEAGFEEPIGRVSVDYRREVKAGTVLRAELRRGSGSSRSIRLVESATGVETTRIVLAPRDPR